MSKTREDEEPCYGGCGKVRDVFGPCPADPKITCNCCKDCEQDCVSPDDAPFFHSTKKFK